MIKTKKQMFIVIGAFALVMLLGEITYAFFNYTRTGTANVIRTGQINFTTTQTSGQNGAISLSNVFPVDVSEGVPSNDPNVGEVTINITGDTEYTGGIEYLVTATNVTNTVNGKHVPISIDVTASSGLGESDEDYFSYVAGNPQISLYKVLADDVIEEDGRILVGYIKSGQDGVNGNVVIKAYLDDSKIAISDTYYENVTTTPTPTAPTDEYGTPASFGEGKVVLTTTEWNSIRTNGISFQVKVEAKEDVWVIPTIPSCKGCVYVYLDPDENYTEYPATIQTDALYTSWNTENETPSVLSSNQYTNDYRVVDFYGAFIGLKLNSTTGEIDHAYLCVDDIGSSVPFCVEGKSSNDATEIRNFLDSPEFYDGGCSDMYDGFRCGSFRYYAPTSTISYGDSSVMCQISNTGEISCYS